MLVLTALLAACGGGSVPHSEEPPPDPPVIDTGEVVLFEDDFNSGQLDTEKWTSAGSLVAVEPSSGHLQLRANETDNTPSVMSRVISMRADRPLVIERSFRTRFGYGVPFPGNYPPYRGGLELFFDDDVARGAPARGVNYAHNVSFLNGECVSTDFLLNGRNSAFFLFGTPEARFCTRSDPEHAFNVEAAWDRWVYEVLVFDPRTGLLTWSQDGRFLGRVPSASYAGGDSIDFVLKVHASGWYYGHLHDMDWIRVSQSGANLPSVADDRLRWPISGTVKSLTDDRDETRADHSGTDVAASEAWRRLSHGASATVAASWWNLNWTATEVWSGNIIYAPASGVVTVAAEDDLPGRYLVIDHGGCKSRILHCFALLVEEGDVVDARTPVGVEGNTGLVVFEPMIRPGLHVHWTVFQDAPGGVPNFPDGKSDEAHEWLSTPSSIEIGQEVLQGALVPEWKLPGGS